MTAAEWVPWLPFLGTAVAAWFAYRGQRTTATITSTATTEIELRKQVDAAVSAQMERFQDELTRYEAKVEALERRVASLESERARMIAWMAWNKLIWPPPADAGI